MRACAAAAAADACLALSLELPLIYLACLLAASVYQRPPQIILAAELFWVPPGAWTSVGFLNVPRIAFCTVCVEETIFVLGGVGTSETDSGTVHLLLQKTPVESLVIARLARLPRPPRSPATLPLSNMIMTI